MPGIWSFDWYYNHDTGTVTQLVSAEAFLFKATGMWDGPFATKQAAVDFYNANKAQHPEWKAPTDNVLSQVDNAAHSANSSIVSATQSAVNDPFGVKSSVNDTITTWLVRIGEILLGLVLIAVGVNGLTKTVSAIKGAGKAAAVAV